MSMMGGFGQNRGEVGDVVATFPTYERAQKAVSALIAGDIPAKDIAVVGQGLRSVEKITGRLGYAAAARSGAINGLLLGLLFSAIFVLGTPNAAIQLFIGVMLVGIAIGMLMSILTYSIIRRRRDYASVTQVIADSYDVTVLPTSIHRARQVLSGGTADSPSAAPAPVPSAAARPAPIPSPAATPTPDPAEPPRYGERVVPGAPGQAAPAGDPDAAPTPDHGQPPADRG